MTKSNAYVKVSRKNLRHNYNIIKNLSGDKKIIGIVKADSYGHGSVECMKELSEAGCDFFAVANIGEALLIREHNPSCDILILGFVDEEDIDCAIKNNFSMCLYSLRFAKMADEISKKLNIPAKLHIKVNTGMNRLGFSPKNIRQSAKALSDLENVLFTGFFSHFSTADEEDLAYTKMQYETFLSCLEIIKSEGICPEYIHIQNSAGICISDKIDFSATTAVRPGIILYGLNPSDAIDGFDFRPVMSFYSRVVNIFGLDEGTSVSYGRKYTSDKTGKAAVICAGYADGYHRALSNKAEVFINGHRCRILGNVCMDMLIVDITEAENITIGDEAELFGENILADELATLAGTINYELLCSVSKRVPRVYE